MEKQKYKNVLLLSAGRRVSLFSAFVKAGMEYGIDAFAADTRPELSAVCASTKNNFKLPPISASNFFELLLKECKERDIGLVIPTIDTGLQLLAKARPRFEANGIKLLVSQADLVHTFGDKRLTAAFFLERDINVPDIYSHEEIKYPVIVKPFDGSSSEGLHILDSKSAIVDELIANDRNMFCQYLDPSEHDEFTCDLYYNHDGDLICFVPRKRLEVRGGEVSKAITCKAHFVSELAEKLSKIDGYQGVLTLQLFVNKFNSQSSCIEINARFGGGYPLTRLAGADYPSWLIDEYLLGKPIKNPHSDWEPNLMMLRYDAEVITRVNPTESSSHE